MSDGWEWYWAFGTNPEGYRSGGATREDAIAAAVSCGNPGEKVTICQGRPMPLRDDFLDPDRVLEWWHEYNEDLSDEDGELHMEPTQAQKIELEAALNGAFKVWRAKHGLGRAWILDTKDDEVITLPAPSEV